MNMLKPCAMLLSLFALTMLSACPDGLSGGSNAGGGGGSSGPNSPPNSSHESATPNGDWQLVAVKGSDAIEVRKVHLRIDGANYHLDAGCNSMNGRLESGKGGAIRFLAGATTLMGCPDDYEHRVQELIAAVERFELEGEQLRLFAASKSLIFKPLLANNQLRGRWRVSALNIDNALISSIDMPDQMIIFGDGRFEGSDGCNLVSGRFSATGESIRFAEIGATERGCEPARDGHDWYGAFGRALEKARKLRLSPDRITVLDANSSMLMHLVRAR